MSSSNSNRMAALIPRRGSEPTSARRLGRRFWIPFLAACVIVFGLEKLFDYLVETEGLPSITQSIFSVSGIYQRLVAAPRVPLPRYTQIIEVNPSNDSRAIALTDLCGQRDMITHLLKNVARALPKAIVLDKYFEPTAKPCPNDTNLIETIRELRDNDIPIIVGRRVGGKIKIGKDSRFYVTASILDEGPNPCWEEPSKRKQPCFDGVVNRDLDTRKAPLGWPLYASREDAQKAKGRQWLNTLDLAAAEIYDEKLMTHHPRLRNFVESQQNPYISFLQPEDFAAVQVSDVLAEEAPASANNGALPPKLSKTLRNMSGKIVLVGEIFGELDTHPSVVGKIPGLYLQANYIEALLDDRYYRPLPLLDYVMAFLIFAALEFILIVYRDQRMRIILFTAVLFLAAYAVLYLFIKIPGWYVNPAPLGATVILIKILNVLFNRAEKEVEHSGDNGGKPLSATPEANLEASGQS